MHRTFLIQFLILLTHVAISGQDLVNINYQQSWQGIPGLERTAKGRLYVSWYSGGDKEPSTENRVFLCYSDDNGKNFSKPIQIAGPKNGARAFDPTLWIDPEGNLWYIFNRGNKEGAMHNVHARICKNPDATAPVFGKEFLLDFKVPYSFRMNKPTVLSSGEWILPVTHATEPVHEWFAGDKQLQGVAISTNNGRSWKLYGAVKAPEWALENMVTELRDGRLWMLIRTSSGFLWESYSLDKGRTWSEAKASSITSPGSRFFIRRLSSGNLLLVNHYKFTGRSHLTAMISTDDGITWNDGLLLDERGGKTYPDVVVGGVSYPDGVQDKDGMIWIIYDRDRNGDGEILMAKFSEEDVNAGKNVSGLVSLKQVIRKLDKPKLLTSDWNPRQAADKVMAGLIKVTSPQVKGAHDASFAIAGEHAYIASMVNDIRPGENAEWPYIYLTLSVVNIKTLSVEKIIPFAKGEQIFNNDTLPPGACFVPRIIRKEDNKLRCYFASEEPGKRESQVWFIDFDLNSQVFENYIHRAKIKTASGVFNMQPQFFYKDALSDGFNRKSVDYGLYTFDFKLFDQRTYAVLNNYPGGQNALSVLNKGLDTFEVIGHYNKPFYLKLTESAVNRLPDGTWIAICRQEDGNKNYLFTTSRDGKIWTTGEHRNFVPNGTNSKPTFDKFHGIYYLGWQEALTVNGVSRSIFNIEISRDGINWERKYRFESEKSFQYPSFYEYNGNIWLTVTQGDTDPSRKERIMFGKLE
jgi:predicted neuraminidase